MTSKNCTLNISKKSVTVSMLILTVFMCARKGVWQNNSQKVFKHNPVLSNFETQNFSFYRKYSDKTACYTGKFISELTNFYVE